MEGREIEVTEREVYVDELKKLIYSGSTVEEELSALLRNCGISEEYAGEVERMLKENIREEVRRRGLPEEEWFIDALYRILVHMTCATLCENTAKA